VLREEARHHHVAVILRTHVLAIATIELSAAHEADAGYDHGLRRLEIEPRDPRLMSPRR